MSLLINCACGQKLNVRDEYAGKKVKCPKCGKVLTAPEEEPVELVMAEEDKPPPGPAKSSASAAWDKKKPTTKRKKKRDEEEARADPDDDADQPTPHWLFPGTIYTEVMAVDEDGIYFAKLRGDALKNAVTLLKAGAHADQALGKKATCVLWDWITSITSNKKLRPFTIHYNNGEPVNKTLTPADAAMRNEIFKTLAKLLAPTWEMTKYRHTPITAMHLPLACIAADFVMTVLLAIASHFLADAGEWEGRGRGAAVAMLLNLLRFMGPVQTGVLGLIIALLLGCWLIARIVSPPIEMSLQRAPEAPLDED